MSALYYFIAILILLIPFLKKDLHHFDIMPVFLFYFDATNVMVSHPPTYQYFECSLILLISLYYYFLQNSGRPVKDFKVFIYFAVVMFVFPIIHGYGLDPILRNFSYTYAAMVLLPLGFDHYKKRGNIDKLLFFTFLMIVSYVLFVVLYATPRQLGGYQSERVGGTIFYYGNVAIRGGITYLAFVMLMVPLVLSSLRRHWQKITLIIFCGIIFILFLTVLKRFVFVIIGLGMLNYMLRPGMKPKYKIRIGLFLLAFIAFYSFNVSFQKQTQIRYEERGGERKFTKVAILNDLRIYEPIYVFRAMLIKPVSTIFIGERTRGFLDLTHDETFIKQRRIHNTYAGVLITRGFIGLFLYLIIYYYLYRYVHRIYRALKTRQKKVIPYWIAFQNMVLIFVLQGMVGGHTHITLRGLVFLYAGALGGVIYHEFTLVVRESKEREQSIKSNSKVGNSINAK